MLNDNNKLVSICIPTYNSEKYIERTLKSIINQTYQNIEIIVSDNASTDDTYNIVSRLSKQENRLKLYRNDCNLGFCANINKAVQIASSNIIAIFHSDDIYHETIVEKELLILESNINIKGVFSKHANYISNRNIKKIKLFNKLIHTQLYSKYENIFVGDLKKYLPIILRYGNIFPCPSFMTRKDTYLSLKGFENKYITNEDFHLWLKYLKSGHLIAIINEVLLYYRISDTQVSNEIRNDMDEPIMYKVIEEMLLTDYDLPLELIERYKTIKVKGYLFAGKNSFINKNLVKMRTNINKSKEIKLFPLLTIYGIIQRLPIISYLMYNCIKKITRS